MQQKKGNRRNYIRQKTKDKEQKTHIKSGPIKDNGQTIQIEKKINFTIGQPVKKQKKRNREKYKKLNRQKTKHKNAYSHSH